MGDVTEVKSCSSRTPAQEEECINFSKKRELVSGDLVVYHLEKQDTWGLIYGTVVNTHMAQTPLSDRSKSVEFINQTPSQVENTTSVTSFSDTNLDKEVQVRWASTNQIKWINESRLCLVDRILDRGQLVRNKNGLLGVVTGKEVKATVQILGSDQVITNIPVTNLHPMTLFVRGQYIVYKDWVGVIQTVKRNLHFALDGGMVFYFESVEKDGFENYDIYNVEERTCPGSRIRLPYSSFRHANWLPATMQFLSKWFPQLTYLYSFSSVTTSKSHVVAVSVEWLSYLKSNEIPVEKPEKELSEDVFKDIQPIGTPSSELVQVNSIRIHRLRPNDQVLTFSSWLNGFRYEYMNQLSQNLSSSKTIQMESHPDGDVPVKVILCQTYLDIEWEDGTQEKVLGAKIPHVCPVYTEHTLTPGLIVAHALEKKTQKYGVVQSLFSSGNNKAKMTTLIKWIVPETEAHNCVLDLGVNEESIYDVKPHPEYLLHPRGTIVLFKDSMNQEIGGTVIDIDIRVGQMIIGSPSWTESRNRWPHTVIPVSKKCLWNFYLRKWITHEILPPFHQLGTEKEYFNSDNPRIVLNLQNYTTVNKVHNWAPDIPQFQILKIVPENHIFYDIPIENMNESFHNILRKEFIFLQENLPTGIWICGYEDRMDLISILLLGEIETPYEDGLFMFDIKLPIDYPTSMPKIKFVAYSGYLSPFIDRDGTFCTSKLIWEFDSKPTSFILNMCQQLKRILFHAEPFYEFKGTEFLKGSAKGEELSRDFNEKVFVEIFTSFHNMALKPHNPWESHLTSHLDNILTYKIREVKQWLRMSVENENEGIDDTHKDEIDDTNPTLPPYPLLPFSKGFEMAFTSRYEKMQNKFQVKSEETLKKSHSDTNTYYETKNKEEDESLDESSISASIVEQEQLSIEQDTDELLEIVVVSD